MILLDVGIAEGERHGFFFLSLSLLYPDHLAECKGKEGDRRKEGVMDTQAVLQPSGIWMSPPASWGPWESTSKVKGLCYLV